MIIVGSQVIGGTSGGGGGSTIPDPDGTSAILGTDDGATWVSKPFGDAFQAFVEPNLSDVQTFLEIAPLPEASQVGQYLVSTGAGRAYTAAASPVVAPEGAQTTDDSTAVNTKWLSLSANRIYRLRIAAVGADASRTNSIVIVREAVIRTDSGGAFAVTNHDLVIDADGGWTSPVDGVSPHLVIVDFGGAAGQVCVKGIDSTTINWSVLTEQLG